MAGTSSRCSPADLPAKEEKPPMTEIFARADWYLERPEPETEWTGVLQERDVPPGPASRTALSYKLITDDTEIPVYAANVEQLLASFVGQLVMVRGKLVDFGDEGYGEELWIASIQRFEGPAK